MKLLLCGLSNAGKTSILKVLDDDVETIPDLGPTPGANVKTYQPMGITAHVWDLGGQSRYRTKYLEEYEKYFRQTSVLYYVIDVQAEDLFKESLAYLKEIVDSLTKLNIPSVFIAILFHKYDLHIRGKDLDEKIKKLWEKVQSIVGKYLYSVYKTSVYDAHSIFQAFSEGVLHPFTETQVFAQRLHELANEFESPVATMLNTSGFVYASWQSEKIESGNLWVFNHEIQDLLHYIKVEPGEPCKILPLTETLNQCAIHFPHKEETIICAFVTPKGVDAERIKQKLHRTQKECEKLLKAFDEVRFGGS